MSKWGGAKAVADQVAGSSPTAPQGTWETLNAGGPAGAQKERMTAVSYDQLIATDKKRKQLLLMAKSLSPMASALKLRLLPRTVVPRLLKHYLTWVVIFTWGITTALARLGFTEGDIDDAVFNGAGTMVTFMIIFYVGYCYTRYTDQFTELQVVMRNIIGCCAVARASFKDEQEVHRLYRYVNMMHLAAYAGLSPTYTRDNFFLPLCKSG